MANPTGTTYLAANNQYTWTDGDVYEIAQSDQQEGAASGASFAGLGVDNQPHQALLNKTQLVRTKQIIDEANIAELLGFQGLFTGLMGQNGYLRIPVSDVSRGFPVQYIIQWGAFLPGGGVAGDIQYIVNWNIPFPNACYWAMANMRYTSGGSKVVSPDLGVGLTSNLGTTSGIFFVNLFNANGGADGFYWMAVGF